MRLWLEQSLRMYHQIDDEKDEVREFKIRLVKMLGEDDKETGDGSNWSQTKRKSILFCLFINYKSILLKRICDLILAIGSTLLAFVTFN